MSPRQLLVLGNLEGEAQAALDVACRNANCTPVLQTKANDAIQELDRPVYRGLLVDLTTPGAARFCHEARSRRGLFNAPLIALSPKLTDLAFSNALRWGADDVVMLGAADELGERLAAVPDELPPIASPTLGEAVIADPERSRCDVLGRVLTNAGISVKYATDLVTARYYLPKPNVSLFVLNAEIGDASALIQEARASGSRADWVVTAKTLDVDTLRTQLEQFPQVIVTPSHGPPENVLFALNLLRPPAPEKRRDEIRALHGAIVELRPVGSKREEFGFSYTVSPGGLYVRTLLPPPQDRFWIEVTPPNVPRPVKLLTSVAWARTFGEAGAELAPPGFALRILDAEGDDLELWRSGFESIDARTRGPGVQEVNTSNASVGPFKVPLPSLRPGRISRVPALPSLPQPTATPNTARGTSRLPKLELKRTASGLTRTSTVGQSGTGQGPVVVPKSTWHPPEPTPKNDAPVLPKPIVVSSQDAVLSAIRSSLLPPAPADFPTSRASAEGRSMPTPPALDSIEPEPPQVVQPEPIQLEPDQLRSEAAEPEPPAQSDAKTSTTLPELEAASEQNTPVSAMDFADGTWAPQRPVRTVLGIGNASDLVTATGALPTPPPFEALDPAAPDPTAAAPADLAPSAPSAAEPDASATEPSLADAPPLANVEADAPPLANVEADAPPLANVEADAPPLANVEADAPTLETPSLAVADTERMAPDERPTEPRPQRVPAKETPKSSEAKAPSRDRRTPPPRLPARRRAGGQTAVELPLAEPRPSIRVPKKGSLVVPALAGAALTVGLLLGAPLLWQRLDSPTLAPSGATAHPTAPGAAARAIPGPTVSDQTERPAPHASTPSHGNHNAAPGALEASEEADATAAVSRTAPTQVRQPSNTDSAAAPPLPLAPPLDPNTLTELSENHARLFVHSKASARVYVHGVDVGETNQWLVSRCGSRFIRLGSAPGEWLSPGVPTKLRCRQANEIELQPGP